MTTASTKDRGEETPLTSLSFLQSLYGDPSLDLKTRIDAAKAALPYEHAREAAGGAQSDEPVPYQVNVKRFSDPPYE